MESFIVNEVFFVSTYNSQEFTATVNDIELIFLQTTSKIIGEKILYLYQCIPENYIESASFFIKMPQHMSKYNIPGIGVQFGLIADDIGYEHISEIGFITRKCELNEITLSIGFPYRVTIFATKIGKTKIV